MYVGIVQKDAVCPGGSCGLCWAGAGLEPGWLWNPPVSSLLQMSALGHPCCWAGEANKWRLHHCPEA